MWRARLRACVKLLLCGLGALWVGEAARLIAGLGKRDTATIL